jgi:hypothetical protein
MDEFSSKDLYLVFQSQATNLAVQTEILKQITKISESLVTEVSSVKALVVDLRAQGELKARDDDSAGHKLQKLLDELTSKKKDETFSGVLNKMLDKPGFYWIVGASVVSLIITMGGANFVQAVGKVFGFIH